MRTVANLFSGRKQNCINKYVYLSGVVPDQQGFRRFVRLYCEDDDGRSLEAMASERHFPFLEPYYVHLQQSQSDSGVETPLVPVVLCGNDQWTFDWRSARVDYPEIASTPNSILLRIRDAINGNPGVTAALLIASTALVMTSFTHAVLDHSPKPVPATQLQQKLS